MPPRPCQPYGRSTGVFVSHAEARESADVAGDFAAEQSLTP
jgi:hypothetical protein